MYSRLVKFLSFSLLSYLKITAGHQHCIVINTSNLHTQHNSLPTDYNFFAGLKTYRFHMLINVPLPSFNFC